jgi:hypothetical protein
MKLCMCFEVGLVGKSMITAVYGVCMIDVWNGGPFFFRRRSVSRERKNMWWEMNEYVINNRLSVSTNHNLCNERSNIIVWHHEGIDTRYHTN